MASLDVLPTHGTNAFRYASYQQLYQPAQRFLLLHFLGISSILAFSACPRCAQSLCCSGVISVGVSPAGTELHRIVSSNPGAEKMKVRLIGSLPMFFAFIQVFAGINTSPPAWRSRS
jgi:hypothetical protein